MRHRWIDLKRKKNANILTLVTILFFLTPIFSSLHELKSSEIQEKLKLSEMLDCCQLVWDVYNKYEMLSIYFFILPFRLHVMESDLGVPNSNH